jgi:hypothetical protein
VHLVARKDPGVLKHGSEPHEQERHHEPKRGPLLPGRRRLKDQNGHCERVRDDLIRDYSYIRRHDHVGPAHNENAMRKQFFRSGFKGGLPTAKPPFRVRRVTNGTSTFVNKKAKSNVTVESPIRADVPKTDDEKALNSRLSTDPQTTAGRRGIPMR